MRAMVVFESMYGNTQQIAEAVARGLRGGYEVDAFEVGGAPATLPGDVDLLVVGGPTHAFGLSRPSTREDAARQSRSGIMSKRTGLREWLDALPAPTHRIHAAAFDTHVSKPRWLPGSAAKAAAGRLRQVGYSLVASPESFYVRDKEGPLETGETDRAEEWARRIAATNSVSATL